MKEPKITVIIPVYNGEETLTSCLNSVLNQTYKNYEIIVVDNNSTDKTKEIILELVKKSKKIFYVFESKKGRGAARNKGISVSKGEIIVNTDCDCIVPTDWLEELTNPIRREDEKAVQGFQKNSMNNFWSKNIQKADNEYMRRVRVGKYINHVDTKNFAIKAIILKKLMFDQNLENLDDLDLYIRLKNLTNIVYIPFCIVLHKHKSSFGQTVKVNFNRGYWAAKIFRMYQNHKEVEKEPMLESISIINFVTFPFWLFSQLFKRPTKDFYFLLVAELSWRAGIIDMYLS